MRIIALTSAEVVNIRAPHQPEFIGVKTREDIALKDNEVGFIIGKKSMMHRGVFCQSGLIHPGWSGKLEPFFIVYGNVIISVGMEIAHAVILGVTDRKSIEKAEIIARGEQKLEQLQAEEWGVVHIPTEVGGGILSQGDRRV